ncbi:MAG: hypothetical protein ABJA66_16355 [Actinomycetota bacterium]
MTTYREPTQEENWVRKYESLVNYICDGYEENIYEYTNDLACRLFIQEASKQNSESILFMNERVKKADEKLQSVLQETNTCIHGNYPKTYFWFWGVPENSDEFMNEAELNHWI